MASPDATPYIDLLLRDLDPQDLVDLSVADLRSKLPNLNLRESSIEMLLIESVALQIAELVYASNRIPSAVVQVLLKLAGIEYDEGAAPEVTVTFNLSTSDGTTIPAGTSVRLDLPNDADPVVFTTGPEVTVNPGVSSVTIAASGDRFTSEANGIPAGVSMQAVDSLLYVDSIVTGSEVIGGRDEELDEDYFERGTQLFTRLTNCLVLPDQFVASMLEEVYVKRAHCIDNYDVTQDPEGEGPAGTDPGHITVLAYGDNDFLTPAQKIEVTQKVQKLSMAALQVHYIDPQITTVDVTTSIYVEDAYEPSDVIDNVRTNLQEFLSPMTWNWKNVARRNDIISIITNTEGVDFVDSLTVPAADQALSGVVSLAQYGDIAITVLADV